MGREENVIIFQDTEKMTKMHPVLSEAVKQQKERQKLIPETADYPHVQMDGAGERKAKVIVSKKRSFEAASGYQGRKVCVLNFASATNPGGGVVRGSSAQEECLCRCSTLFFSLNSAGAWDGFYTPHRNEGNPIHNDDIIYTPDVCVFKSDTAQPKLLPEAEWYRVNVLSCAAPNLRPNPSNAMNSGDGNRQANLTRKELQEIHEKRLARILDVAAGEGNEVVILGAFGCGAFQNPPEVAAQAAKNVISSYLHVFATIEFAVYCSPRDESNYTVFERTLREFS